MPARDHALLYDRECGLCTWIVDVLLRWDRAGRLRPVALQDPEAERLLPALTAEQRMASFHLAGPDGQVRSGGDALPALMGLLPAGTPLKLLLAAAPPLTDRAYRWVAEHRVAVSRPLPRRLKDAARERVANL